MESLNDWTSYDTCSCAQANNIGKLADNVNTNLMILMIAWFVRHFPHWQVLTSPFNRAKKELTRVSRDWPKPHPARALVNVKFDAELNRVGVQPGLV